MQYINSNTTPREALRQFGFLPESLAEEVIDAAEFADRAGDIASEINESAHNIGEDFLQEHINDVQELAKKLRGDNRNVLLMLIERMEQTQLEMAQASEYAAEKRKSAIAMCRD